MDAFAPYYALIKALHVAFMVTWFAGLFYLPRLFIYHTEAADTPSRERFQVMERRLFAIMTIGAVLTAFFGLLLIGVNPGLLGLGWFQLKLALLVGLIIYHYRCHAWIVRLRTAPPSDDTKWLRWFNEIPVFFLLTVIILAVTKAF
ncbi:MAG: CopD family protein [Woeseiaceae bacterium]|nr:CopD family protein [Woeseiaceae bacterium]